MKPDFELGGLDKLMEKLETADADYKEAVKNLISHSYRATKIGLSMQEIASICTMGWMMGENPELEGIYHFILSNANKDETIN